MFIKARQFSRHLEKWQIKLIYTLFIKITTYSEAVEKMDRNPLLEGFGQRRTRFPKKKQKGK